jgi:hypothetical protein
VNQEKDQRELKKRKVNDRGLRKERLKEEQRKKKRRRKKKK